MFESRFLIGKERALEGWNKVTRKGWFVCGGRGKVNFNPFRDKKRLDKGSDAGQRVKNKGK